LAEAERPFWFWPWDPDDPVKEFPRRHRHRPGQLDQGVDPGNAFGVLQLADLGAVQGGAGGQLLLGETFAAAGPAEVLAEAPRDLD